MKHFKFWLKLLSLLLLWGVLLPRLVHAQPGAPDPSFGSGTGFVKQAFLNEFHASPDKVMTTSDGRILVIGGAWQPNGTENGLIAIARFLSNGAPDPTFGNNNGKVTLGLPDINLSASDLLILPDGNYLLTGYAYKVSTATYHTYFCRIRPNGSLDTSFDGDGFMVYPGSTLDRALYTLSMQPDGKILASGYYNSTGYDDLSVARFKPDCTPDPTFGGGDGLVSIPMGEANSYAYSMQLQPDGKILIAGEAIKNGWEALAVLRLKPNGDLDPSFSGDGKDLLNISGKNDSARKILLQSGGKIVVAGYYNQAVGSDEAVLAVRYTSNGVLDTGFGDGNGIAIINVGTFADICKDAVLQPDGKILLGGSTSPNPGTAYRLLMIRLTADGKTDPSFGTNGISVFNANLYGCFTYSIALQTDGRVLSAGPARVGDYDQFGVARFITGVTVDTQNLLSDKTVLKLYPNPVTDHATLEYALEEAQTVKVDLFDAQGRFVTNLSPSEIQSAGHHSTTLTVPPGLPRGVYMLYFETESGKTAIEAIF